jgi:hypothetical protein
MTTKQVPTGFEASHAEWLRIGGQPFRKLHQFGPRPDFYRSEYWKLVKEAVLISKGFKCFRCSGNANQVHHLNYDRVGEDHLYPETLAAVCRSCHGLVEYARNAESIISRIFRRISLCKGFLDDSRGCHNQNAAHVYARLLEYQDELAELKKLFANKIYYSNPRIKSKVEAEAVSARFRQERQAYEEQAANTVSTWNGTEKEKAERMLPMLELEIQNCQKFVAEVFEPVPLSTENLSSEIEAKASARSKAKRSTRPTPESGNAASGVESLVVGIKFHRGHVDGIAQGDGVELVREPENAYDPNAIQVKLRNGETLGYLTREFVAVLAKQMDVGSGFRAQVSRIVRDKVYVSVTAAGHGL